ncbi:GNAT family N-acetyltransferase [Bacillus spizizenii]|uniref:GNAT family N-acetyltransferase n=1 Tax=Bacillus spizizenii TaxID=96241 RepID=UPI0005C8A0A5|nr:GNAT family protein [Bacillus spizizenii]MDU7576178.1 GNAT family protein [Bacillus subtilis]MCY7809165.1 GNAT family N-acetyltransferase [Bacillus spizizenii]MCY7852428.1 GNAT family N-acetyltransferase [Bacillus spizizenii]MCY8059027.1 GNAT family N-acetyltransferase [Bacillus spizizenii]MCY8115413.1 GNAT family N-acetyltransferase [Bacillus spizizenii]
MVLLETNRLLLKTIDIPLLDAASKQDHQAMKNLGYETNGEWPNPDFFEAIPYFREKIVENNGTKGFDSWIILKKDNHEIVGGTGFLGDPDTNGMIEIGFATNKSHRRKGYCVEAAQKLITWALSQDVVNGIRARCEPDNVGSQHILGKLGFTLEHKSKDFMHWRYVTM